jgi:hypothetical protein
MLKHNNIILSSVVYSITVSDSIVASIVESIVDQIVDQIVDHIVESKVLPFTKCPHDYFDNFFKKYFLYRENNLKDKFLECKIIKKNCFKKYDIQDTLKAFFYVFNELRFVDENELNIDSIHNILSIIHYILNSKYLDLENNKYDINECIKYLQILHQYIYNNDEFVCDFNTILIHCKMINIEKVIDIAYKLENTSKELIEKFTLFQYMRNLSYLYKTFNLLFECTFLEKKLDITIYIISNIIDKLLVKGFTSETDKILYDFIEIIYNIKFNEDLHTYHHKYKRVFDTIINFTNINQISLDKIVSERLLFSLHTSLYVK